MPIDIDTLNGPQREAVVTTEGPLLVLAGAGSGKTRVLTYRIANILEQDLAAPWEILAITFTNKAAAEMRERLAQLVGTRSRGMWVSTFHSMCVRMLRADAERLGFTKNFTIYDTDDLKRLYKDIMAELNIDPKRFPVNQLMNRISQAKNDLVTPGNFDAHDPVGKVAERLYERLQERLRAANAFDFDDLLLYGYLLLKNHEDVREAYQDRFRYLMVDEYQDTNRAQYAITQLLAAGHRNIMVVGDDDQSIYSWRGADLRNILEFESDYPEARVVKLEQNYRSVGNILAAANAVIANNRQRKEKRLFTAAGDGDKISVYLATDERDEGRWIAGEIDRRRAEGTSYNNMAVFYRTNAQSRMLEDMLLRAGVPYRIVGGTRFFDRAEIRDVMAYLTLVVNPADDIAAKRVVNVPRRGIGKTTIERIDQYGREMSMPFLTAAELAVVDPDIRASTRNAVGEFIQVIKDGATYGGDLRKVVEMIIDKAGLIRALQDEGTDEARGRIENIQEFLGVVDEFVQILNEYGVSVPASLTMLGRSLLVIQGMLTSVSPDANVIEIVAEYVKNTALSREHIEKKVKTLAQQLARSGEKLTVLPTQLSAFLSKANAGQLTVNVKKSWTDAARAAQSKLLNRLIFALLDCSLLFCAAITCLAPLPRVLGLPWLALVFFAAAVAVTIALFDRRHWSV